MDKDERIEQLEEALLAILMDEDIDPDLREHIEKLLEHKEDEE
jgi:hypothetical protein